MTTSTRCCATAASAARSPISYRASSSAGRKTRRISNYGEYHRRAAYLFRYTRKLIGIVMGVPTLRELFEEQYYADLEGGILESFGRLFKNDLKLYVYPLLDRQTNALKTVENLEVAPKLRKLYAYLVESGCIEQLDGFHEEYLSIFSRDVIQQIKSGDPSWSDHVPPEVAEVIRRRGFFGHKKAPSASVNSPRPAVLSGLSYGEVAANSNLLV